MDGWYADPKIWIPVVALIGQAAITHWRVDQMAKDLANLEITIDGLREWRAQAKEQIRALQNGREE